MQKMQSNCPSHLQAYTYERFFPLPESKLDKIWKTLNLRESFVRGQLFPYRVEFDAPEQHGPFATGELNIHHGPGLSAHGAIGEFTDNYRDLKYFYGSYVLSFRWIRPTQLEFFKEPTGLRLKLHAYVHPRVLPLWKLGNHIFWKFLGITFLF